MPAMVCPLPNTVTDIDILHIAFCIGNSYGIEPSFK